MNAETILREHQWRAMESFAAHELLGEAYWSKGRGARWEIGRPDTFVHRAEVIAGLGGSLIVHGDIHTMRFAQYGDHADAWSRLLWLADGTDVGYYVAQKAQIGMDGRRDTLWEYDEEVALADIRAEIADLKESGEGSDLIGVLEQATLTGVTGSECELHHYLRREDEGWDLWERSYGRVLRMDVVAAHVALNKCAWLLREKYGDEGPPFCRGHAA